MGSAGTAITAGPSANWRAVSNGRPGYVVDHDYWQEQAGRYEATVALSTSVPVNVEVWDATTSTLLARRSIPPTNGQGTVSMPVDLVNPKPATPYRGFGPFTIQPIPPTPGHQLEIRIWTPGGGTVSVSALELVPARASRAR